MNREDVVDAIITATIESIFVWPIAMFITLVGGLVLNPYHIYFYIFSYFTLLHLCKANLVHLLASLLFSCALVDVILLSSFPEIKTYRSFLVNAFTIIPIIYLGAEAVRWEKRHFQGKK
jgi:hypothetical protein